jgi:hypothetical protein
MKPHFEFNRDLMLILGSIILKKIKEKEFNLICKVKQFKI